MLAKPRPQRHVAPAEPERQHHFALRLPDDRGEANADAANGLAARAGGRHQPADQADQLFEIALAIIVGGLVHFGLHDALEIGHGAIELALAGLDADDRMRRAAELDACPGTAPDIGLVKPVIRHQVLGNQILDHPHHRRDADVQSFGKARG